MSTLQLKNQQRKDLVPEKRYHPNFTKEIPMKKLIAMRILVKRKPWPQGEAHLPVLVRHRMSHQIRGKEMSISTGVLSAQFLREAMRSYK